MLAILRTLLLLWLLRQAFRLLRILLFVAVLAVLWPVTGTAAAAAAAAWALGWPPTRLYRAAGRAAPMTAVYAVACALRYRAWRAVALAPVTSWQQASGLLLHGRVLQAVLITAPVAVPAGLAVGGAVWAWRTAAVAAGTAGRVRDRETPAARDARAPLRGRIRHNQCQRVLTPRPRPYKDHVNLYYACSPDMSDPRTAAKYPGHVHARLSDKVLTKVIAGVLDQRVFGRDRAAMLTAQLPATAAEKTADRDRQAAALRRQLKKIETSQAALMTELEETGADPAAAEYRQRIRTRYRERAAERTAAEQQLAELETQTAAADDPALLAVIPRAAGKFTTAPPDIREALYAALDVQILYRPDQNQMTIWVTITDATPQAIQQLLNDPRTDADTGHPAETAHASSTAGSTPDFGTPAQHTLW